MTPTTPLVKRMIRDTTLALSAITLLFIANFGFGQRALQTQRETAAIVDLSAEQQTLLWQIASNVTALRQGAAQTDVARLRRDLAEKRDRFIQIHQALLDGDAAREHPAAQSQAAPAIRGDPPRARDRTVETFLAGMRRLLNATRAEPGAQELDAFTAFVVGPLSSGLDAIKRQRLAETTARSVGQTRMFIAMTAGSVLIVILLGGVVFRPMIYRVEATTWELLEAHQQVEHLAFHDLLTELPNRRYLNDHLERTLARAARIGLDVALLHVDLDHFKKINDSHGHDIGDLALSEAAGAMTAALRRSDFLARIGGDEFAVVVTEFGEPEGLGHLANRLIAGVEALDLGPDVATQISLSIGVALSGRFEGYEAESLLKRADQALYNAKEAGRARFCLDAESCFRPGRLSRTKPGLSAVG